MPFGVMSEVSQGMGLLDGDGDRQRGRGSFEVRVEPPDCNHWGLFGVVVQNCMH